MNNSQNKEITVSKGIVISMILMALVCVACAGIFYVYHSPKILVKKAEKAIQGNRPDDACVYLERAIKEEASPELQLMLADVYNQRGNLFEYEYLLGAVIDNPQTNVEQLEGAYRQLINRYKASEDYPAIQELLMKCSNEKIKSVFENYLAKKPDFSLVSGKYDEAQTVKLSSASNCKIYYSTTGIDPTTFSTEYAGPIFLDEGTTAIKAIAVNEYGIVSEVSEGIFEIYIKKPDAPKLNISSGTFFEPVDITVLDGDEEDDVYYTTDGSWPDVSSMVYSKPIPLPIGDSVYSFIRIIDGIASPVVKLETSLQLQTDYTPEAAIDDLLTYFIKNKKIRDKEGHVRKADYRYSYVYQYVQSIENSGTYYFIAEYMIEADETVSKTGTVLAVDIYTKDKFKVQFDENGGIEIISIDTK